MSEFSLFKLFIYLLAAVLCVPLSKRLGFGSVLGYLFAGILIGPFVLGPVLGTFPAHEADDMMEKTEFGVVMMLFLVGLGLDPKEFWKMRRKIIGIGGLQLCLTILLVIPLSLHFVNSSLATAIAIGSVIAMSSTAIILQTLSEKGLSKTPIGRNSFLVLLFQDISVIPILAILPLLVLGPGSVEAGSPVDSLLSGSPGWMKTIAILAAIGLMFFIGNYIVNPFFKYMARLQVRELFTAAALMLVIGVSVLMEYVGLSPALGAFMAGMALANSEFKHQLEIDIEPFKTLLLGLFFIAVGSIINFSVIASEPVLILSLVFGIILLKALVLIIVGFIFGLKLNQNILFAILLSQIGEFAFVILNLSGQINIIPTEWIQLLTASTAITMAITPILLIVNEKWIIPMMGMRKIKAGGYDDDPDYDFGDVSDQKVIIAGYGDFGLTLGRIIKYSGFSITVLDDDSERIELLRKLGYTVYFGDASNPNILRAAGADSADILVAAKESSEVNRKVVKTAMKNFPHLKIFIRTKDRFDSYYYLNRGFNFNRVYRESFFTAVQVGVDILHELGINQDEADRLGKIFAIADRKSLEILSEHSDNLESYIQFSKEEIQVVKDKMKEGMDLEMIEKKAEEKNPDISDKQKSHKP